LTGESYKSPEKLRNTQGETPGRKVGILYSSDRDYGDIKGLLDVVLIE
jgi:hypothetical protein